jgi:hypothetical protein
MVFWEERKTDPLEVILILIKFIMKWKYLCMIGMLDMMLFL